HPDPRILDLYHLTPSAETVFHKGRGCPACHGQGFESREGFFELLTVTPAFREAIQTQAPETELRHLAVQEGMEPLLSGGLQKAKSGRVSLEEMMRVIPYEVGARFCPTCLHPLEHDYNYCPECAHRQNYQCTHCGKKLQATWKICPECGGKA
ncbi:MAG: zinc ribbon domain-containing protein, partial [Thermodesulfobacteriota bacterium]